MRILLTLLLIAGFCTCVRAQVGTNVDAEYASWCMVDVIAPGNVNRFTRLVNIATLEVLDIDQVSGAAYTFSGTLSTCEAYDLQESTSTPVADYYEGCQCTYTINQEDHRVIEIRGGTDQDYTVEFQEVVRRQCSTESTGVVVHRDTLTKVGFFTTSQRVEYVISFDDVGDYIDDLNIRKYGIGSSIGTAKTADLNPTTVVASYPSLSLNAADFEYDGSNLAAMAAAYTQVLVQETGTTQNLVQATAGTGVIRISSQYLHEASGAYAILPWNTDGDYLVTGPAAANLPFSLVSYFSGLSTITNTYTEYCEDIYTAETGAYYYYSELSPRQIQINVGVDPIYSANGSNPIATCDAPPEICADVATTSVEISGCVTICDTVDVRVVPSLDTLNVRVAPSLDTIQVEVVAMTADTCGAKTNGHQQLTGSSDTYSADTYNSLSLTVISGTVSVTIDGVAVDYPTGYSARWAAPDPCDRLSESFLIDAANGSVIIASLQ